jgi:hypothetical protein
LRLIETSDLSAIHNLHSLVETDEFNTLGIPEDSNETRGIIESWITSNKEKKRAIPLLLKILIQVNSLVCLP